MNKKEMFEVEGKGEQEESSAHCTAACQYANKVACVCGCGGRNHGSKSVVKMDFFIMGVEA